MPACWIECPVSTQLVTFEQCLRCAHSYEGQVNPATGEREMCRFRYPYLHYLATQAQRRKKAGISTTMLTGCLRKSWWNERRDYAIRPGTSTASVDGTAWHALMDEHQEPETMGEQRLQMRLPSGYRFTGQFDRLIPVPPAYRSLALEDGRPQYWIEDFKHKRKMMLPGSPQPEYVLQLNIYRYMIERGATNIDTGEILSGRVTRLTLLPSTHDDQGVPVPVPLLDLEVVEAYLEECMTLWHAATPSAPPPHNVKNPAGSYFCTTYCPHVDACCGVGGEPYDPTHVIFMARKER